MEITDSEFQKAVKEFVDDYTDNAWILADAIGVSCPAVKRWAQGKNLPHQVFRSGIVAHIAKLKQAE